MAYLDETGLAELWRLIKAEDAKAPKIATGSYVGTGTYGSSNPCSLTFDFVPTIIFVQQLTGSWPIYGAIMVALYGVPQAVVARSSSVVTDNYLTWSNTKVSWYSSEDRYQQMNESGCTYKYVAIA